MNDFKEYLRFPDLERVSEYTAVLETHGIPFHVDDSGMRLSLAGPDDPWRNQFVLKLKEADMTRAEEAFNSAFPQGIMSSDLEESINSLSDKYIVDILSNRNEHSEEEINMAMKIANARNIIVPVVEESPDGFPSKPAVAKSENAFVKFLYSAILFVIVSYTYFKDMRFTLALIAVLFIHELGHFLAMKYFKYADLKMFFIPLLGALVTGKPHTISQKQRIIILLAGPVPGIIIGLFLYAYSLGQHNYFLMTTAKIFIYVNVFNLLPFTPLDGGRVIGTIFFSRKEILELIFSVLSILGLIFIAYYLHSYILLILPFTMLMGIMQRGKGKKLKQELDEAGLNYNKPYTEMTNEEYWLVRAKVISHYGIYKDIKPDEYKISGKEQSLINHVSSLATPPVIRDLTFLSKTISFITWLFFLLGPSVILIVIKESYQ
jgi:stage IV sporulation protein FB